MASRNKQFILSLGRNNVQTLKEYQREKLATTNGNLATTKQFQKHFKLKSKEETLAYLKDERLQQRFASQNHGSEDNRQERLE